MIFVVCNHNQLKHRERKGGKKGEGEVAGVGEGEEKERKTYIIERTSWRKEAGRHRTPDFLHWPWHYCAIWYSMWCHLKNQIPFLLFMFAQTHADEGYIRETERSHTNGDLLWKWLPRLLTKEQPVLSHPYSWQIKFSLASVIIFTPFNKGSEHVGVCQVLPSPVYRHRGFGALSEPPRSGGESGCTLTDVHFLNHWATSPAGPVPLSHPLMHTAFSPPPQKTRLKGCYFSKIRVPLLCTWVGRKSKRDTIRNKNSVLSLQNACSKESWLSV